MQVYGIQIFTEASARTYERGQRTFRYVPTTDGRTMIPATHIGPDRLATVSSWTDGGMVLWAVYNAAGERLLWSSERNHARTYAGWVRCMRRALEAVYHTGVTKRVRPEGV